MCPHLNISLLMVNMLNDWLERPIVMRGPGQTLMTSPRHEPHLSLSCLRVPSSVPGRVSPGSYRNIETCSNTNSGNPGKTSSAFWTMSRNRRKMPRSQNTLKSRSQGGKRKERKVSHESGLCLLLGALPIIIMITHSAHRSLDGSIDHQ